MAKVRTNSMSRLILYYQLDCHLCDEAEVLMHAAGLDDSYEKVDIETDLELLKRYGIYVPVLMRRDNEMELFWPFDHTGLNTFLEADR
jgi:hypothetical protein